LSYGYADFGCIGYFNKRAKELQVYTLKSIGGGFKAEMQLLN